MPTAEAPLSSQAMLEQGEGGHGETEAPEAPTLLASSPTPVPFQHSLATQPAWGRAKAQERWREVDGDRAPREGALGPRWGGKCPPPKTPH